MRIVKDDDSSLVLRDRSLWLSYIFVAAAGVLMVPALSARRWNAIIPAALFGMFAVAFLRSSDIVFDKLSRVCIISRRDMWRKTTTAIPFANIKRVLVEPMPLQSDSATIDCRLSLDTSSGVVPLTATYQPYLDRFEDMRRRLSATLYPEQKQPSDYDPLRDLVAAGRTIDAVNLIRRQRKMSLSDARTEVQRMRASLGSRETKLRP